MKRSLRTALVMSAVTVLGWTGSAVAQDPLPLLARCKGPASCHSPLCQRPWNGPYYDVTWGCPMALVVPPTADVQTHWGWGVGNYRITPNCPQFKRNWWGPGYYNRACFQPTPAQPSDTDQFGDYYVRGPW